MPFWGVARRPRPHQARKMLELAIWIGIAVCGVAFLGVVEYLRAKGILRVNTTALKSVLPIAALMLLMGVAGAMAVLFFSSFSFRLLGVRPYIWRSPFRFPGGQDKKGAVVLRARLTGRGGRNGTGGKQGGSCRHWQPGNADWNGGRHSRDDGSRAHWRIPSSTWCWTLSPERSSADGPSSSQSWSSSA